MKKFTLLLMVAILACLVMAVAVGCGDRNTPQDDPYYISDEELYAKWNEFNELCQPFGFADNTVMIELTNEASLKCKYYTTEDFKEVGAIEVWDSHYYDDYIQNKLQGLPTSDDLNFDIYSYKHTVTIILNEHNAENVVRACILLSRRDDVDIAHVSSGRLDEGGASGATTYDSWIIDMKINDAWALTQGSEDVLVGVLDSGIDHNHSNLVNRIYSNLHRDFTTGAPSGIEVPVEELIDDCGHGTLVAGVIAAEGIAGGTIGTAPNVRLVSLKVATSTGYVNLTWVANAINYAKNNHIKILNASLGDTLICSELQTAVLNYDGIIVCSAGNDGHSIETYPRYPASYSYDQIIVVGNSCPIVPATDSNYGKISVDLFAEGEMINSTVPTSTSCTYHSDTGYLRTSGTSFATPMVTGTAALILSLYTNITPIQIKCHILNTVTERFLLKNLCLRGGELNAKKALEINIPPTISSDEQNHCFTYQNCPSCSGTHIVTEPHTYGAWQYNNGTGHYHTCTGCGYTETVAHTYAYVSQGSSEHSRTCSICGYSDNESHQLAYINLGIYQGHRRGCAKCSYTLYTEAHTWYYNNHTHINHCMKCNATAQYVPIIQNIEEPE